MNFKQLLVVLALCPVAASADWSISSKDSSIQFISTKKSSIAEVHHFKEFSGTVTDTGEAQLEISLNSVETQIDIRNQRMQEHLFQTDSYPLCAISTNVAPELLKKLKTGQIETLELELLIDLHGKKLSKVARFSVYRLKGKDIKVVSAEPIIINASDFGLGEGIDKLKQLAGLPSISTAVPVLVDLVLHKD